MKSSKLTTYSECDNFVEQHDGGHVKVKDEVLEKMVNHYYIIA